MVALTEGRVEATEVSRAAIRGANLDRARQQVSADLNRADPMVDR